MFMIYARVRANFRKRIMLYGETYKDRTRKHVRSSIVAMMAGCCRPILRERAKQTLLSFFQKNAENSFMVAKIQKFYHRIILTQRIFSLRIIMRRNEPFPWQKKIKQECLNVQRASRGLLMLTQAYYHSNTVRQKEIIENFENYEKEQYIILDELRKNSKEREAIQT